MKIRERNGLIMALSPDRHIELDATGFWIVPSQKRQVRHYKVYFGSEHATCDCPDFRRRCPTHCKHIWAVHYTILKENGEPLPKLEDIPPPEPREKRPERQWPLIRKVKRNERKKFPVLLADLCASLKPFPESTGGGRPRIPISDIMFGIAYRVFRKTPAVLDFMDDYEDVLNKGYVSKMICPNSLLNYMGDDRLTPMLVAMIEESAAPLAPFEHGQFAIDATGISVSRTRNEKCWRSLRDEEERTGKKMSDKVLQDWAKLVLICGVKTKVVASVKVLPGKDNESPYLPQLAISTAKRFRVRAILADKQFLSVNNFETVNDLGGMLYCPFKDNNVDDMGGIWQRVRHFFLWNRPEFDNHFRMRPIVESVFHVIKNRFGERVTSRSDTAIMNEVLCKVLCHNLVRVIYEMAKSGLEPEFRKGLA